MIRDGNKIYGEANDPNTVLSTNELTNNKLVVGAGYKGVKSYEPGSKRILHLDSNGLVSSISYGTPNKCIGTDASGNLVLKDMPPNIEVVRSDDLTPTGVSIIESTNISGEAVPTVSIDFDVLVNSTDLDITVADLVSRSPNYVIAGFSSSFTEPIGNRSANGQPKDVHFTFAAGPTGTTGSSAVPKLQVTSIFLTGGRDYLDDAVSDMSIGAFTEMTTGFLVVERDITIPAGTSYSGVKFVCQLNDNGNLTGKMIFTMAYDKGWS